MVRLSNRRARPPDTRWIARRANLPEEDKRIDLWVSRLGNISQFGLLAITIAGLYFTVIPLYQKALLEEAIAKKEVELKEVSTTLEESYRRVRESAVNNFAFGVGASCSGMMLPPRNSDLIGIHIPNRKPYAQEILEIDPQKCLVEASARYPVLRSLRVEDMATLQESIASLAREFDKKRYELADKSRSSWESQRATDSAREYSEFVRSRLLTLKTLTWKQR